MGVLVQQPGSDAGRVLDGQTTGGDPVDRGALDEVDADVVSTVALGEQPALAVGRRCAAAADQRGDLGMAAVDIGEPGLEKADPAVLGDGWGHGPAHLGEAAVSPDDQI